MSARPDARVYAALVLHTLISGASYLASKHILGQLAPGPLVVLRLWLSAGVFTALLAVQPRPRLPPREKLWTLAWLGLLAGPLNQGLYLIGLSQSTPAHAALLYALTPSGVYLLSLATRRERPRVDRLMGLSLAFAGVAVLLLARGLSQAFGPMLGDVLILGGVAAWVLYTTEGKRFAEAFGPLRITAWTQVAAAGWSLLGAPFIFRGAPFARVDAAGWASVAYLVLAVSVVSYLLWHYALSHTEASRVTVFSNLQPVVTAVLAALVLGDPLTWESFVGGALVLLGVRLTQRTARPVEPAEG